MTTVHFATTSTLPTRTTDVVVVPHELLLMILNPGQWMLTRELRRYVHTLVELERDRRRHIPRSVPPPHDPFRVKLSTFVGSSTKWSVNVEHRDDDDVSGGIDDVGIEVRAARRYLLGQLLHTFADLVRHGTAEACVDFATTNCAALCAAIDLTSCRAMFSLATHVLDIDRFVSDVEQLRCSLVLLAHCVHRAPQVRISTIDVSMKDHEHDRLAHVVVCLLSYCDRVVLRVLVPRDCPVRAREYRDRCYLVVTEVYDCTSLFSRRLIDALFLNTTADYTIRFIVYGMYAPRWIEWTRLRDATQFVST